MSQTIEEIKPTREHAVKILDLLKHGLSHGKGDPEPGKMCVEAAVCFAMGLPHSDEPPCVAPAVRSFKIILNDSNWSSNLARAKGLRRLAIAQLGINTIDQTVFVKELALATIRKIVPIALRSAAKIQSEKHKAELEKQAVVCESVPDDLRAASAASDAASAASDAASYAASAASDAACDRVLCLMAECGVEALIVCKSPGCEWLDIAEKEAS